MDVLLSEGTSVGSIINNLTLNQTIVRSISYKKIN